MVGLASAKFFPQALQEDCQLPVGLTRPGAAAAGLPFAGRPS